MAIYWVGYDLDKSEKDYSELIERLQQIGASRILKSHWLLPNNTNEPNDIRNDLRRFLGTNYRIIVAEIKNSAGWRNLLISDAAVTKLFAEYAT